MWGFQVDKAADDEDAGVNVRAVTPGGPAAQAGLKTGDRLLTLDDHWTDTVIDCYQAAARVPPGTDAPATVRRDGQDRQLTIRVRPGDL